MSPQINMYNQKIQKSASLPSILFQGIGKNNYNQIYNNSGIITTPNYLTKNYSTSIILGNNNQNFGLNKVYKSNSPISTSPTNNITINYNPFFDNKNNNLLYSMIKKNNNFFKTPQKLKKQNIEFFKNINNSYQNNNHLQSISLNFNNPNLNQKYFNNINTKLNTNISPNSNINKNKNINYNLNQQYFINSKDKLDLKQNSLEQSQKINIYPINGKIDYTLQNQSNNNTNKRIYSNSINSREEPKENFDPNEFTILKQIGEGTYGKIYLTLWMKNNKKYAMKKEKIKGSEALKKNKEKTKIVTNFIKKTGSKGVIKIYGDLVKKKGNEYHYYVLMEMADKDWEKELFDRQKYKQFYSEKELFIIMNQLIKTLSLLQKNHITHRDVKPQNVLISNGIYKLSDFGEARKLVRTGVIVSRVRGTELYMAPILFHGLRLKLIQVSHNTYKSDVFSFGMCIFFASTLTFNSLCDIRELSDMRLIKEQLIKYLSGRYSFKLINILYEMLQVEENNRPDFITLEKKYFL